MRNFRFVLLALLGLGILVGFTPAARADSLVLFSCQSVTIGTTPCTGTVAIAGGQLSTTGIQVFNISSQYPSSTPFKLVFDTNAGTISITQQSGGTDTLTGKINNFTPPGPASFGTGLDTFTLNVSWTSLPAAVCAASGASAPCLGVSDFDAITFQIDGGTAKVVHIGLRPIPEPATLSLFGSGLIVLGGLLRRKLRS